MILLACICAFIISFVLTVLIYKYIAPCAGFMDTPSDDRRMHTKATPLIGGLAVYIAFCLSTLFLEDVSVSLPYLLGGAVIVLCGMIDDRFSLHAGIKLLFQIIAGIVLCALDVTVEHICFFGHTVDVGIFEYPLTVLWIVAVTNALNLIDGLDGLCTGLSIIISGGIALTAILNGHSEVFVCAMIFMCACLGFLPHNKHPAKIFAGDTGSMFFGFALATMCMEVTFVSDTVLPSALPIVLLGIPIFDTVFAIIRRLRAGTNIFKGDKKHIHHVLSERYSHSKAVLLLSLAALLCDGIALLMTGGLIGETVGYVLTLIAVIYAAISFGIIPSISVVKRTSESKPDEKDNGDSDQKSN